MSNPLKALNPMRLFKKGPLVPVVRLSGIIGNVTPLRPGLTLANVAISLERAFAMAQDAVAIEVNSPGGSPVQSQLIFKRIRDLAREKSVKVYVFVEDVAASGGYWIACAGDEIYADAASILGSIGVISQGFGFVGLIDKLGVERRVYTAGEKKLSLDPFQPENPQDVAMLKHLQSVIHQEFINLVRDRRGRKVDQAGDNLFTGEFWTGRQALELGLIDGIIDLRTKMRQLYGDKVRLKLVSPERGFFRRRVPGVSSILEASLVRPAAMSIADDAISAFEARAIWARYGL